MERNPAIRVRPFKSIESQSQAFKVELSQLVQGAWNDSGAITRDMRGLVRWYIENAYFDGLLEGGVNPDQLTGDDKDILDGLVLDQQQYVPNFTDAVRKAKDDQSQRDAVRQRIDLWAESIYAAGQRGLMQAQAKYKRKMQWHTARDEMVCNICGPLNDKIVDAGKQFGRDGEGMPIYSEPAHPHCILPGNEIVIPDLVGAAKSFYVGRCIEITLGNGRRLTVTENHPILTPHGWVKAHFLREDEQAMIATDSQGMAAGINPYYHYRPTVIEEIFNALEMTPQVATARVPASAEYFYGDGRNIHGDVHIIGAYGFLRGNVKPEFAQAASQFNFNGAGAYESPFSRGSLLEKFGVGTGTASGGSMCGKNLSGTLGLGHTRPLEGLGFGLSTWGYAGLQQPSMQERAADAHRIRNFLFRFSSDIAAEPIVKIRDFQFSGHVFDLQARMYGLYICNGVIVKNCRCTTTEYVD